MVTAFLRNRDKIVVNKEFDDKKLKGLAKSTQDDENYINCDDVPFDFENVKPFIHLWQLVEGPWQMKRFHEWYIRASSEFGLTMFTVIVPNKIFCRGESIFTVNFEDLHALYRRKRLDVSLITI